MADLRIPPGAQALVPAAQPARSDAARAAQRAFFNQALASVQTVAAVHAQPQTTTAPQGAPAPSSAATSSAEPPSRFLRPGSLLDIRV